MKLIDIISERGIILNHQFEEGESLWNSLFDLLGTRASFSISSESFKESLKKMEVLDSDISRRSIYCLVKSSEASKPAVLFVRLRKAILSDDGEARRLICFVVINSQIKEHAVLSGEVLQLFKTYDLEKLFSRSKNSLHAFHLLKQFAMKNVVSTELHGGFSIYGPESTDKSD